MPKRNQRKLPSRLGRCRHCNKDIYPDRIGAELALEFLSNHPPRGAVEPRRVYPCPHRYPTYHLTSDHSREMFESA